MNLRALRIALTLMIAMTLGLGLAYPAVIAGLARAAFPDQATGSLVYRDGTLIGSHLIGQQFSGSRYFWGRPSATTPQSYNALASNGSNLGPLNPALLDQLKANAQRLRDADPGTRLAIPVDLVTASASGLDPEVSLAAAYFQIPRIARARGLDAARLQRLVGEHSHGPWLGVTGEPRVNVLELNLALDTLR